MSSVGTNKLTTKDGAASLDLEESLKLDVGQDHQVQASKGI